MRGRAKGPGRLWKRGKFWVLDFVDEAGGRHRKSLSSSKREAEQIRADIIRRRDLSIAGLGIEAGQEAPIAEVVGLYLDDLKPRVTEAHFRNVSQRLERTLKELEGLRVQDLKPLHLVRIRSEMVAKGLSHRTANLVVTTVQAALRWAVENEMIGRSPVESVKKLPESAEHRKYKRRAMSEEEIESFLEASRQDDDRCELIWDYERVPQTQLWITFLETGARWSELRLATWGDLSLSEGLLVLKAENTKSRKQRVIPMQEDLVEVLRRLKMLHETVLGRLPTMNDRIFLTPGGDNWLSHTTNAMRIFDRLLEAANIPKVTVEGLKLDIHALRHTFGTRLARAGAPLAHTQALLGHSDPKLTASVYTHLDHQDLRAAIEMIPRAGSRSLVKKAR